MPLMTVITQLHIKKMKPVCTDGTKVKANPSSDISDSFWVRNPHPSPTSKLNDGPAKLKSKRKYKMMNRCKNRRLPSLEQSN